MLFYQNGTPLPPGQTPAAPPDGVVCFAQAEELPAALGALGIVPETVFVPDGGGATRFESHNGFDYMALNIPDLSELARTPDDVGICFTGGALLLCGGGPLNTLRAELAGCPGDMLSPARVLNLFFGKLMSGDGAYLDGLEDEISAMEDGSMEEPPRNCAAQISALRKKLLALKRYYESLLDLLEDLEENRNGFFTKAQLRYIRMHTSRADRLLHNVINLRDYVTQVREAYQNQLDISLNKTMKLFTVITTIFLPLTLIVGWYGMNLQMPEYSWAFGYPIVVGISLLVIGGCILFFKRKKWF